MPNPNWRGLNALSYPFYGKVPAKQTDGRPERTTSLEMDRIVVVVVVAVQELEF
jgi:hypothetical protein